MGSIQKLKKWLYPLKLWYQDIFQYPKDVLRLEHDLNYDVYWDVKRGAAVGTLSDWQKARADIIMRELPPGTRVSLSDIGCGEGSILRYIKKHALISEATGYDSSAFVLQKANDIGIRTKMLDIRDEGQLASIEPADYMLLLEVLEHIPNSEKVLAVTYERARKGVFLSFPNSGFFTHRLRLLFGKFPKQWINFPNEHLRFWTIHDVKWWLKALGYKEYRMYYYKGIPLLNIIRPEFFAAGQIIFLEKTNDLPSMK